MSQLWVKTIYRLENFNAPQFVIYASQSPNLGILNEATKK